jgi:eukaryotic-like serine/threonine-protein kinase
MSDPPPIPPRGLVAGKYEVVRLIGRGGMGAVWEGRHVSLGTRVAIKFIDQEYAQSKEARTRFETEARAAAALQSKHAIQIYDHGLMEDGRPYMVMEMLGGEPLDERIDRLGRMSLQDTARILGQVCRALQRAHEAGIIHRDLKPENIFLVRTQDDDDEIAKVLDFGIAKIKAAPGEQGLSSSTKTGAVLGTPYYMAPEQARGLRTIDFRADLWSLGIIAYKCVTGVLPFEGESVGDLLVKICTSPPPVPSVTVPGLPPAFDYWFARTMEREPMNRFGSATELADTLALAAGISVRRGPMSSQPHPQYFQPQGAGFGTPQPTAGMTPLPMAGMTSAPFVTSAGLPSKSSRGVVLGVMAAALVGGTVGVIAVVKLTSARNAADVVTAAAARASVTSSASAAPPPVAAASSAPTAATMNVTDLPAATSTPTARPTSTFVAGAGALHGKPAPTGKATAPSPTTAATPAPTPAATKPPVRTQNPTSDPGY